MVSFGVTAREKACVELIQWHACSLVVLQFNHCTCQGHTGCTAGGDGLLRWRVQHECTGTRGQDAYSQVWEEETLEQEKKQRKVRNRRRKGKEEQAVDEEGTTYKDGAFSTTFCKYFLGKWLEMCSFLAKFTPKSCPNLTHRLTLLHDFSVVVGQTPTKVYIFGNYD